jgi:hypothetical protein
MVERPPETNSRRHPMRKLLKCGQPARESLAGAHCDERAKIGAQRGPAPGTQVARRLIARLHRSDLAGARLHDRNVDRPGGRRARDRDARDYTCWQAADRGCPRGNNSRRAAGARWTTRLEAGAGLNDARRQCQDNVLAARAVRAHRCACVAWGVHIPRNAIAATGSW